MSKVSFFTAITYTTPQSFGDSLLETVDNYFYLGGKKAHVIPKLTKQGQKKAVLSVTRSSILARIAKLISYFTIVIPCLMLSVKTVLRATHSFKLIDQRQKMERGLILPESAIAKIQELLPRLLYAEDEIEYRWISLGNNWVFKLNQYPELVFKLGHVSGHELWRPKAERPLPIAANDVTHTRFENMVTAKEVCVVDQLDRMVVPHAKKFTIHAGSNDYVFIVEERLDFDPCSRNQDVLYHQYSSELNDTVRQLACLVAKCCLSDVKYANFPLLTTQSFQELHRVALIDLEDMNSATHGFLGADNGSPGLICCVPEAQISTVVEEAARHGYSFSDTQIQAARRRSPGYRLSS